MRTTRLDPRDLQTSATVMLAAAVAMPLLPVHNGIACPLRTLTGVPCPLCGMTTSVEAVVRFDFRAALEANPAGIALVLLALILLTVRPRRVVVPSIVVPVALAAMWAFELHRYGLV
jgi:MFS superfamily sulfate permease-like transporter